MMISQVKLYMLYQRYIENNPKWNKDSHVLATLSRPCGPVSVPIVYSSHCRSCTILFEGFHLSVCRDATEKNYLEGQNPIHFWDAHKDTSWCEWLKCSVVLQV